MSAHGPRELQAYRVSYGLRLLSGLAFLGITLLYNRPYLAMMGTAYMLIAVPWALLIEYRYEAVSGLRSIAYLRRLFDVTILTLFIYLTGHVHSFLVFGYVVITALSSIKEERHVGIMAVVYSSLTFAGLSALVSTNLIPPMDLFGPARAAGLVYSIAAPVFLALACTAVNQIVYNRYHRAEESRIAAEEDKRAAQAENESSMLAAVMAEKARLEVEAYNEFARLLNSTGSFDQIIEKIFDYIQAHFSVDSIILYLYDGQDNVLRHHSSRFQKGTDAQGIETVKRTPIPMNAKEGGAHWQAFQKKRHLYFPRIRASVEGYDRLIVDTFKLKSFLTIPLVIKDEAFGVIDFTTYLRPLNLGREDLQSISAFCEQIAGAVKSSLLVHEAEAARKEADAARIASEKAREELAGLSTVTREVNASGNLDWILDRIFAFIENKYDIQGIWLQFIDPEAQELYTYRTTKPPDITPEQLDFIRNYRVPLGPGGGMTWEVYKRKKPFYIPRRPRTYIYEFDKVLMETMSINSVLFVPLSINEEVIAVIVFTKLGKVMRLKRAQIESISRFCDQIAGAINNSRLHTESEISRMMAEQNLKEIQALKNQQDLDYYLTSNLIDPLTGIKIQSETVEVEEFTRQKKSFPYKRWNCEIGGDINVAHSVHLKGRPFTVFMNADAMGKSIQGAGGILVLGSVLRIIIERTSRTRYQYPEQWLKNTFQELDLIFRTFEGSMYISLILGMLDDNTGIIYYISAEHPYPVVYRGGRAELVEPDYESHKLGFTLGQRRIAVNTFRLLPGDAFLCGSDGRDDIEIRGAEGREVNTDDALFLRHIEKAGGDPEEVFKVTREDGTLMDDFSLISISYMNRYPTAPSGLETEQADELLRRGREISARGEHQALIELLTPRIRTVLDSDQCFGQELDERYGELIALTVESLGALGRFQEAKDTVFTYIETNPCNSKLVHLGALFAFRLGELETAADYGERASIREPEHAHNLALLAETYMALKNENRSAVMLKRLAGLDPEQVPSVGPQSVEHLRDQFKRVFHVEAPSA